MRRFITIAAAVFLCAPGACGISFMVPTDSHWAPLNLESHRVTVDIADQSARTRVVEVFRNQHSAQLEATLIFPLPKNAAISDFKMYVNGRLVTGEIMEAGQARHIYEDIVRRTRDPGLLEYAEGRLFRLKVFPIPPGSTQEVQIAYEEALSAASGLVEYVYPLKTPENWAQVLRDFTLTVNISASAGVKNVYSPTHEVSARNIDDRHAVAGFEKMSASLDRDFRLFYEITNKDFGASLISTRPAGKDGFFMLLVSPRVEVPAAEIIAKDVVFVIDTSGSMQGEKLEQARKALSFCVNALNGADRFNIISFAISAEKFQDALADATPDNRRKAGDFINNLRASGGTNIDDALVTALSLNRDKSRPYVIVFLTDGVATVGQTSPDQIISDVKKKNEAGTRIFSFGVGYDVNTILLDQISEETRAATQYVEPQENIETKVSSFFERIGAPVLADASVNFANASAYDIFPPNAGDLFRGGQLIVTGRYRNPGAAHITVRGRGAKGELVFEYPVEFASGAGATDFVANVWAGRKIAYLLGQIRLHGENSELKDEVVRLSREFGIVTPYTSYLVTEGAPIVRHMPPIPHPVIPRRWRRSDERFEFDSAAPLQYPSNWLEKSASVREQRRIVTGTPTASTGKAAVRASEAYNDLVSSAVSDKGYLMRAASGRTFYNIDGVWVDESVKAEQKVINIKFGSTEYFDLFAKAPKLKDALALGDTVVISVGNFCLVISEEESTKPDSDDFKGFLKALEGLK